jgi:hypothetical protein
MTSTPMTTLQRRRLVDETLDAYVDWREECYAVSDAYDAWAAAEATDAELAFEVYSAVLDREESASKVYAGLIRRVGDLVRTDRDPETDLAASGAGRR